MNKAPSLGEAKRIKAQKILFSNKTNDVNFANNEKLLEDDIARKNAILLIACNLNKVKTILEIKATIRKFIDD